MISKHLTLVAALVAVIFAGLLAGCQDGRLSLGPVSMSEEQFNRLVIENEDRLRSAARTTTTLALGTLEGERQATAARYALDVARVLEGAVADDEVDLAYLQQLAGVWIAQSDEAQSHKRIAGEILAATLSTIEQILADKFDNASPDGRTMAVRALIRGLSAGVIDAAEKFAVESRGLVDPAVLIALRSELRGAA